MKYEINRSDVANTKITAITEIQVGDYIGTWVTKEPINELCLYLLQEHMDKKWWETDDLGRYCNHSSPPNTIVISTGNKLELISCKKIQVGEEVLVDCRKVIEFTGYPSD